MRARLEKGPGGLYFELVPLRPVRDLEPIVFQSDWDFPGLASNFGYVPCKCGATDGTVNCTHKTATEMISAAYDFLSEHVGESIEDPGYFGD
jgi:hypothetical protein